MTIFDLIENHEGRRNAPYLCPAGAKTIGVGWNMDANPLPNDIAEHLRRNGHITDDMIDQLLAISVRHATADARSLFPDFDNFTERRRMALVDFLFQLGYRRARGFAKSIAAINTGRWEDAAKEMLNSTWATQTPRRAKTITDMVAEG